jgi:hypothetical protein
MRKKTQRQDERRGQPGPVGLETIIPRIGKTPRARLAWAVNLVHRDLKSLTPGDYENLRLELAAFLYRPIPDRYFRHLKAHLGELPSRPLEPVPWPEVPDILHRIREVIECVVRREPFSALENAGTLRLIWNQHERRWFHVFITQDSLADQAADTLWPLIVAWGHLVRTCPAPKKRGKPGEACGAWFVAKRPNQLFCTSMCQSRASTRAKRNREREG